MPFPHRPMSIETENRIVAQLEQITATVDRLDRAITGGDDPGRGLLIRIDRLEQSKSATGKWLALIGTAAAGAFASNLWRLFKP